MNLVARKARVHSTTGIYHIIIRGIDRQPIFADDLDKEKFLELLAYYTDVCEYQVYGYCLLDNHLHLLIKEGTTKIGNMMKRIGVKYVAWYNGKYNRSGQLFHDRFKSEVVETDDYLLTVLRYIHQEPVRLGIATEVSKYAYSSYGEYIAKAMIVNSTYCLNLMGNTTAKANIAFKKYMNEPSDEKCLEADREKMSDDQLGMLILRIAGIKTLAELTEIPKVKRNEILRNLKELDSVSSWQIARVSGFSQSVVSRA